ncbi:protein SENSITIVE TO UV [Salix suchowensis]|nr:protein SENSITIVE TO UV [Salix suchowensis]
MKEDEEEEEEEEEEGGFEEWGADFLEQLIQVEEHALSSQLPSSISPPPTTTKLSYLPPPLQPPQHHQDYQNNSISYSPPRELSQRPIEFGINYNNSITFDSFSNGFSHSAPSTSVPNDNARDLEIDRLKRELGRVSKHLTDVEKECFELKKDRRKKDDQIKSACAKIEKENMDVHSRKKTNLEHGVHSEDVHGIFQHSKNAKPLEDQIDIASTSKAIGVQTERGIDFTKIDSNNDSPSHLELSKTLLGIWGSTSEQQLGRNLISKLFMACMTDFQVLFGCMSMDMSSKVQMDYMPVKALLIQLCSIICINNGVQQLEALFRSLLDLCDVPNVAILSSSLHILLVFLKYLLSLGTKLGGKQRGNNRKRSGIGYFCSLRREQEINIKYSPAYSSYYIILFWKKGLVHYIQGQCQDRGTLLGGSLGGQDLFGVVSHEASHVGCSSHRVRSFDLKHLCKKRCWNADTSLVSSSVNWVSLFELMLRVAVSNTDEYVRLEAVSIMNVILMSANAYTQREKFGQLPIFESIAQLLKREAGSRVQKEALHLLFLLLNCSKLLSVFCSGCKEAEISDSTNDQKITSTHKGFSSTLEAWQNDIELRKRAIIMLAFLASSGKSGFEIMVTRKLPGETNFLMLILQVLVSKWTWKLLLSQKEASKQGKWTLLIREALILLNRLVSNPGYSPIALRVLTARRDMASLTIDIANRLSQEDQRNRQSDVKGHVKESEIVELVMCTKEVCSEYFLFIDQCSSKQSIHLDGRLHLHKPIYFACLSSWICINFMLDYISCYRPMMDPGIRAG